MDKLIQFFVVFTIFISYIYCSENEEVKLARIESCPGCSLNRLPEVKKFIYEDIPKYDNVEFKKIHGAPPELVLLNSAEKEIERLPLSKLSRDECNQLLIKKGFKLLESSQERSEF